MAFSLRAGLGREEHRKRQDAIRKNSPNFDGEFGLSYEFHTGSYTIILRGRPDAVYSEMDFTIVEEIKTLAINESAFNELDLDSLLNFRAQLDLYCYILHLQGKERIKGRLFLVNLSAVGERVFDYEPDFGGIAYAIERALSRLLSEIERRKRRKEDLQSAISAMTFPYLSLRPYQKEMMDFVAGTVESGGRLMLSAPTGSGKTAGVLFPALVEALKAGKKVYFATARGTQRAIVRDFLARLRTQNAPFSVLFLTARAKLCPRGVEECDWDFCEYKVDFTRKFEGTGLTLEMEEGAMITGEEIAQRVTPVKLCPFAVTLKLAEKADIIVGDYNYVFDPRITIRKLFAEGGAEDWILIIDEAHNLPDRARGYYSPEVTAEEVEILLAGLKGKSYNEKLFKALCSHLRRILKLYHRQQAEQSAIIELNRDEITALGEETESLLMRYILQGAEFGAVNSSDAIVKFLYDFSRFCNIFLLGPDGFATVYLPEKRSLKIHCLDPGLRLKETMEEFYSVIAMSATLEPRDFFANMLGFYETAQAESLPYPFPTENRRIRIISEVSTKYQFRARFSKRIAEIIDEVFKDEPGGYFVFFPSFAFMREVSNHIKSPFIAQNSGMTDDARWDFLLEVKTGGKLYLAVLGGIFAEGVDYPGQLTGVMVVGPGLPLYCLETELQRGYFDEVYGQGFEYAYVFPGMNRVIQAAGRLIRSETDRGTITLIDARFLQEPYRSLIPGDWYIEEVEELCGKEKKKGEKKRDKG
jgi:DNA excision repair protein ERCC-2